MHFSTKILVMRSAYYVDGGLLGPASSLEELHNAFLLQLVFLLWKSEIGFANGPVFRHLLVPMLKLIFVWCFRRRDSSESDQNYFRYFAGL